MSEVPTDLRYTRDHEWLRLMEDGTVLVGVTDHAQDALGDLVFVEVPELGGKLAAGDACAVVESVKAASDVYLPGGRRGCRSQRGLADSPELLNGDPYGEGWLMRIQPDDSDEIDSLMSPEEYEQLLEEEGH